MIRTEDDVRQALASLESDAPLAADVVPGRAMAAHPQRRSGVLVAAAVVATLGVALGGSWLARASHGAAPRPSRLSVAVAPSAATSSIPGAGGLRTVDFTVRHVAGFPLRGYDDTMLFQRADFAPSDGSYPTVTRYRPGVYHGATSGPAVQIGGVTGHIVADAHPTSVAFRATDPSITQRAVVWQYAPNAWAMATGATGSGAGPIDRANLLLARAVVAGSTTIRIPFRLGYLPAGLTADSTYASPFKVPFGTVGTNGGISFRDGSAPAGTQTTWGAALDIIAFSHPTLAGRFSCTAHSRPLTVGTDHGCYLTEHATTIGLVIVRDGHAVRLLVEAAHYGHYSDAQLVDVLAHLTLAPDFSDPSTWLRP